MSQFHVVQAGFIQPVMDGLVNADANIKKMLVASGLNKFNLDDAENYVPVHSMYAFFDELNRKEDINDFQHQFIEEVELISLSQDTVNLTHPCILIKYEYI